MKNVLTITATTLALAACQTLPGEGYGTASTPSGSTRAEMTWQSNGTHNGIMSAELSNGDRFQGQYFQITRNTRVDTLDPLWYGWGGPWRRPWRGWGYWGPETNFVTTYSGRVVANLEGANGTHMRCRFNLRRPTSGMAGGGIGTCQLPNGQRIDATFPPAST